jgi:hypothetical protein
MERITIAELKKFSREELEALQVMVNVEIEECLSGTGTIRNLCRQGRNKRRYSIPLETQDQLCPASAREQRNIEWADNIR